MTVQTLLIDIPQDECAALLASTPLGRVSVMVDGRPEIFPVNHVYDAVRGTVVFPTNDRTKLHGALNWPYVAFEIDGAEAEIDGAEAGGGWSVLVVGRAEEIEDEDDIARLRKQREVLWAAGERAHWVRIVSEKVTGRRISATAR